MNSGGTKTGAREPATVDARTTRLGCLLRCSRSYFSATRVLFVASWLCDLGVPHVPTQRHEFKDMKHSLWNDATEALRQQVGEAIRRNALVHC